MLRGLQSAASGMIAQQRKQDALSHNLANIHTPGYKQDEAVHRSFPNLLLHRIRDTQEFPPRVGELPAFVGPTQYIGNLQNGVYTQEVVPNFGQGDIQETGNPLDVAIIDPSLPLVELEGRQVKPSIFFAVRTPDGEVRYTRNGRFDVDANGRLVTPDGFLVLNSQGQPVEVEEGSPLDLSQLALVQVDNPRQLVREGNNVYRWEGDNDLPFLPEGQWNGFELRQGYMERSNVDPAKTMADMMITLRLYEANQKVIQAYDRTMELLNQVGRIG